jgi:hypothetical protein
MTSTRAHPNNHRKIHLPVIPPLPWKQPISCCECEKLRSPFLTGTVQLLDFSEKISKALAPLLPSDGTRKSRLTSARLGLFFTFSRRISTVSIGNGYWDGL